MEHGSHDDVASTLSELERKLKELEQELESVGRAGETAVEPAQAGWAADAGPVAEPEPGPPPTGATPVTAEWHGGTQPPPQPTFHAAVPPPPQPAVSEPPAAAAPEPAAPAPAAPAAPAHASEWRTYATPSAASAPPPPPPEPEEDEEPPATAPQAAAEPATAPQAAAEPAAAPQAAVAGGRLDELLRVREELVQTADRLVVELQRVLEELGATAGAPPEPPRVLQSGRVAVEAEPFHDLASLSAFEQALAQTPGVSDVYVRSLDSGRARLEVELEHAMALGAELRGCSPLAFDVVDEREDAVSLRLGAT